MPAAELVVQHDLDDFRLNLHLTRRAVLNGVEIELNLVETIGKVGRLQQRGLSVHVEAPFGRQQRLHARCEVAENVAAVGVGHFGRAIPRRRRDAIRGRQRSGTGAARDDVVQIETAGLEPALEDANQVSLHRVVVAVRLQNHLERLTQRDVFQLAAERPLHVGIGHDAQPRVADDHQQQVRDRRRVGERDGDRPRAVEIAALLAFVELRDGERAQRRPPCACAGPAQPPVPRSRAAPQPHQDGSSESETRRAHSHDPRFGSKRGKPYEI